MKTLKSILILSLCIFCISSCKKEDDMGGTPIDEIPSGMVRLSKFGMQAFFPENKWGNRSYTDFDPEFKMDCMVTFLLESETTAGYSVTISFGRLVESFENESLANEKIGRYKYAFGGFQGWTVSEIIPVEINGYKASKIECEYKYENVDRFTEDYFIYQNKKLYRIILGMPKDEMAAHYTNCMKIINTLKITD